MYSHKTTNMSSLPRISVEDIKAEYLKRPFMKIHKQLPSKHGFDNVASPRASSNHKLPDRKSSNTPDIKKSVDLTNISSGILEKQEFWASTPVYSVDKAASSLNQYKTIKTPEVAKAANNNYSSRQPNVDKRNLLSKSLFHVNRSYQSKSLKPTKAITKLIPQFAMVDISLSKTSVMPYLTAQMSQSVKSVQSTTEIVPENSESGSTEILKSQIGSRGTQTTTNPHNGTSTLPPATKSETVPLSRSTLSSHRTEPRTSTKKKNFLETVGATASLSHVATNFLKAQNKNMVGSNTPNYNSVTMTTTKGRQLNLSNIGQTTHASTTKFNKKKAESISFNSSKLTQNQQKLSSTDLSSDNRNKSRRSIVGAQTPSNHILPTLKPDNIVKEFGKAATNEQTTLAKNSSFVSSKEPDSKNILFTNNSASRTMNASTVKVQTQSNQSLQMLQPDAGKQTILKEPNTTTGLGKTSKLRSSIKGSTEVTTLEKVLSKSLTTNAPPTLRGNLTTTILSSTTVHSKIQSSDVVLNAGNCTSCLAGKVITSIAKGRSIQIIFYN